MLTQVATGELRRGDVIDITESGTLIVVLHGDDHTELPCDMLVTTDTAPPVMAPGDEVLAWTPAPGTRAVVLGRIGPSRALTPEPDALPETLLLQARHSMTLRVGEGSITIREDGKILIKGKDLVSHAQRINRIKGGAVAIN